jgi:hypothetical protein
MMMHGTMNVKTAIYRRGGMRLVRYVADIIIRKMHKSVKHLREKILGKFGRVY